MRRLVPVVILLASTLLHSGCISETPVSSLTVPALRVGDHATFVDEDVEEPIRLEVLPRATVPTADLAVVDAYVLRASLFAGSAPSEVLYYHAGTEPAIGYIFDPEKAPATYHALDVEKWRVGQRGLAFMAFHGLAGRELAVGDQHEVAPHWLGIWSDGQGCTLEVRQVYQVNGARRADLDCTTKSDRTVVMTVSDGSPFPIEFEAGNTAYRLRSLDRAEKSAEAVERVPISPEVTRAAFTTDGPAEREALPYSLREAAREVREGLPTRTATRCLNERPEAALTAAHLYLNRSGQYWSLTWSSADGDCHAANSNDEAGVADRQTNHATGDATPWMESGALDLSDAFGLWEQISEEPLVHVALSAGDDGELEYDFRGEDSSLVLDASALRLGPWMKARI